MAPDRHPAGAWFVWHRVPCTGPALRVRRPGQRRDQRRRPVQLSPRRRQRLFGLRAQPDPQPHRQPPAGSGNQHVVERRLRLVAGDRPGPVGGLVRHRHAQAGAGHGRAHDPGQ
ncbi:hypothetical protein G6F24_014613 [Rhizopus arrhizus]|nr:hypothetical protein G6F24_014613 [Rhizopus arrhizus]